MKDWIDRFREHPDRSEEITLLMEATELLRQQSEMLGATSKQVDEWQRVALGSQRATRELAIAFRLALESPDIDIRDDLDGLISNLSDAISSLEEHLVIE